MQIAWGMGGLFTFIATIISATFTLTYYNLHKQEKMMKMKCDYPPFHKIYPSNTTFPDATEEEDIAYLSEEFSEEV